MAPFIGISIGIITLLLLALCIYTSRARLTEHFRYKNERHWPTTYYYQHRNEWADPGRRDTGPESLADASDTWWWAYH